MIISKSVDISIAYTSVDGSLIGTNIRITLAVSGIINANGIVIDISILKTYLNESLCSIDHNIVNCDSHGKASCFKYIVDTVWDYISKALDHSCSICFISAEEEDGVIIKRIGQFYLYSTVYILHDSILIGIDEFYKSSGFDFELSTYSKIRVCSSSHNLLLLDRIELESKYNEISLFTNTETLFQEICKASFLDITTVILMGSSLPVQYEIFFDRLVVTCYVHYNIAHSLYNKDLNYDDNISTFGKCVNTHGHRYGLLVSEAMKQSNNKTLSAIWQFYVELNNILVHNATNIKILSGECILDYAIKLYEQKFGNLPLRAQLSETPNNNFYYYAKGMLI